MSTDNSEQLSPIGGRIKEERKYLGLSQDAFAKAVGVHRRSQINYESGEREPDTTYLEAIAKAGVDIVYVLTGKRSRLQQHAMSNMVGMIQDILELHAYDRDFEDVYNLIYKELEEHWEDGDDQKKAYRAMLAILSKSPIVLLDKWLFEDLIEKLEFVLQTKNMTLSSTAKARAIMCLYKAVLKSGKRVELEMVESAIEAAQ